MSVFWFRVNATALLKTVAWQTGQVEPNVGPATPTATRVPTMKQLMKTVRLKQRTGSTRREIAYPSPAAGPTRVDKTKEKQVRALVGVRL